MFTYGGMPKKQVTVSNSSFIFKVIHDIRSCFSIFFSIFMVVDYSASCKTDQEIACS